MMGRPRRAFNRILRSKVTTICCVSFLIGSMIYPQFIDDSLSTSEKVRSINGGYSMWSTWSSCICGVMTRTRTCNNPIPEGNRIHCADLESSVDVKICNVTYNCPQNGRWSEWSPWSPCSKNCKDGVRKRQKECNNPPAAYNGRTCKGKQPVKTATCDHLPPCPIDGGFGKWGQWSPCSRTCGEGTKSRKRQCNNPAPKYDGKPCSGELNQTQKCSLKACIKPTASVKNK